MEKENRVCLRRLTTQTEDLEDYFAITGDERVMVSEGVKPCGTFLESCTRIRKVIEKDISLGIALVGTDRIIGTVTFQSDLHRLNKRAVLLGYDLAYKYWGNGYMPEAVELALKEAFVNKKAMIVSVSHFAENDRSRRVIEKVGFQYEGKLRQEFVRFDNRVFDSLIYSMTKEEYDAKYIEKQYKDTYV